MKKVWFGVGAIAIIILLLLATRFTEFTQLEDTGYAIKDTGVASMLMREIGDEKIVKNQDMCDFSIFDWIYKRGSSYYLGEEKKVAIDIDYPLYLNDGATIKFVQNKGKLYDQNYETMEIYEGLMVNNGVSYNPGGERADACDYIFYGMTNGLFINTLEMSFVNSTSEEIKIPVNSIIYFTRDHLAYYIFNNGMLEYGAASDITDATLCFVGGKEIEYFDLLFKLDLVHIPVEKESPSASPSEIPVASEEPEIAPESNPINATTSNNTETNKDDNKTKPRKDTDKSKNKNDDSVLKPKPPKPSREPNPPKVEEEQKSQPQVIRKSASSNSSQSRGVRPDSMRPDRNSGSANSGKTPDPTYIKPTIKFNSSEGKVYRIGVDLTVEDPARRLYSGRMVQVELYEIDDAGKEKLVFRGFTNKTGTMTIGDGAVKPDSNYRVNVFFTYLDEYDQMTVENVYSGPVYTTHLPDDAKITLDAKPVTTFYDNMLRIPAVNVVEDETNDEALYGIKRSGGMLLTIEEKDSDFKTETKIDSATIKNLKDLKTVVVESSPGLKPNSSYTYTITATDYFGNPLTLVNNTGEFDTCKSRPTASIEVVDNEIGKTSLKLNISDEDSSVISVSDNASAYDVYFVLSEHSINYEYPITKELCDEYLAAKEAGEDKDNHIYYVKKFGPDEYTVDNNQLTLKDYVFEVDDLQPDTKYYGYVFTDFNINNGVGDIRFGNIGSLKFTSASFNTLGFVYVNSDIYNVTSDSADLKLTFNTARTNDTLEELIDSVVFEVYKKDTDNPDNSTKIFDIDLKQNGSMDIFKAETPILIDLDKLDSMTEYEIKAVVTVEYAGKPYVVKADLTNTEFKTMRKPASVSVNNLLLAAGNMKYTVRVDDPDDAITGNSSQTVVMNIYKTDGTFVKAMRIDKNKDVDIELRGLETGAQYSITFVALEYNEGYDNTTYESNYILDEIIVDETINLSGTIKLMDLYGNSPMKAKINAEFYDPNRELMNLDFYIDVEKNGELVEELSGAHKGFERADYSGTTVSTNAASTERDDMIFKVEKGENTYDMTLYIIVNNQKLVLDTLEFTTEQTVIPINNEYEFIREIKKNRGNGKYLICADLSFDSQLKYSKDDVHGEKNKSDGLSPKIITTITSNDSNIHLGEGKLSASFEFIFNGEIDFQGYTLSYNYKTDNSYMFKNTDENTNIHDFVLDVSMAGQSGKLNDEGVLVRSNYGHIHDFIVHYNGGATLSNTAGGLICEYNAISGLIENFVIKNEMTLNLAPLAARNKMGLLCYVNYGTVRNGYVYGDDIYTAMEPKSLADDMRVGGIIGYQSSAATTSNVFSLVNVIVQNPSDSSSGSKPNTGYAAIIGSGDGRANNMYSVGQSTYNRPYTVDGVTTNFDTAFGPAIGSTGLKKSNVYYWNEKNVEYTDKTQDIINLATLYDYSWQAKILGDQFDVSPVEVGYYPHVLLSQELPEQEYIPLPNRDKTKVIDVMSMVFLGYANEEENEAYIEVRLSNTKNADITSINFDFLDAEIDKTTFESVDGYTTFKIKVSNPEKYLSKYKVESIDYMLSGKKYTATFDPKPTLSVDFYHPIYTVEDWTKYVVGLPDENSKLMNDISFAGVAEANIVVKSDFKGKLDGNGKEGQPGYALKDITLLKTNYLFSKYYGNISNINVENYTVGATNAIKSGPALIYILYGYADNVHMNNVNLNGYGNIGALAGQAQTSSSVTNCSAKNVNITYLEPVNTNTDGSIGGLVGYSYYSRVNNCYVTGLNMQISEIKNCNGAGGVLGYAYYVAAKSLYAQGDMVVRGSSVGGVIGSYYASDVTGCMENLIANVNVTAYQDNVGGLIGITQMDSRLTDVTNMSGVAFGNVYAHNPGATDVSYTVGSFMGTTQRFYGSNVQLFNGTVGVEKDENTYGLLTVDEYETPLTYTDVVKMERVYDFSYVEKGYMPHLYYEDTNIELPYQDNIPIRKATVDNNKVKVSFVKVNENYNQISITLDNPEGYRVTGLTIDDLILEPGIEGGESVLIVKYKDAKDQKRWKDSYTLTSLKYEKVVNGETIVGESDFSENPVRIPLTLYAIINSVDDWNRYMNPNSNNSGNYDNYKVGKDIKFIYDSGEPIEYFVNAKIGRLVGDTNNGVAVLSNINISGDNKNFIFRLNSEMKNITFKDCDIQTKKRNCVGIIGTSSAEISNVNFENIVVSSDSENKDYQFQGMIGYQIGGKLENINLSNIRVGTIDNSPITYIGGLCGYAKSNTLIKNVTATNVKVRGKQYVAGLVGYAARVRAENIHMTDLDIMGNYCYIGGMFGYNASPRTSNNSPYLRNVSVKGTPVYDSNGRVVNSSTVIAVYENVTSPTNDNAGICVGGIAGRNNGYKNGWVSSTTEKTEPSIVVDGIVVKGYGNYAGGAFGYNYDVSNVYVKNTLVTECKVNDKIDVKSVGGISGYAAYNFHCNRAENVTVSVTNHSNVGGAIGYKDGNSSSQKNIVENCVVKARLANDLTVENVGGFIGNNAVSSYDNGVINTSVIASSSVDNKGINNVGGLIGYTSSHAYANFYYAAPPASSTRAAGSEEYIIEGYNNVGGLIGFQYAGQVYRSYTNGNAIADNYYAGGLTGAYNNAYSKVTVGSKYSYTSSAVQCYNNYSAGTVKAKNYAGGFFGQNTMATDVNVCATHQAQGGRDATSKGGSDDHFAGDKGEGTFTYQNMILTESVTATNGSNCYAFSGTTDKFEGNNDHSNATKEAFRTIIWDGLTLNGTVVKDMSSYNTTAMKHPGTSTQLKGTAVVTTDQLKGASALNIYKSIVWYDKTNNTMRGKWCRIFLPTVGTDDEWEEMGDKLKYQGKDLLPHTRINLDANPLSDWLTLEQSRMGVSIPVPEYQTPAAGRMLTSRILMASAPEEVEPSVNVYASGVDTINVEFGKGMENNGTYKIYYYRNDYYDDVVVVAEGVIPARVISLKYTYYDELFIDYEINDVKDSVIVMPQELANNVMVYGDYYYYINEDYVVKGTVKDEIKSKEDEERLKIYPSSDDLFIHLYKGKALTYNGDVYNLESEVKTGSVSEITKLDKAIPLQRFNYNGQAVETYYEMTQYISDEDVVTKSSQLFLGQDGEAVLYDNRLARNKYASLIYKKNGYSFNTILTDDGNGYGHLKEMQQGEDKINAPEDFDNDNIIAMSNNYNTNMPVVLVRYYSGKVAGYNYQTNKWVVHPEGNSIHAPNVGIFEYFEEYFNYSPGIYANMADDYNANAMLIQNMRSGDNLRALFMDLESEDEGTGETEEASSDTKLAKKDNIKREEFDGTSEADGLSEQNGTNTESGIGGEKGTNLDSGTAVTKNNGSEENADDEGASGEGQLASEFVNNKDSKLTTEDAITQSEDGTGMSAGVSQNASDEIVDNAITPTENSSSDNAVKEEDKTKDKTKDEIEVADNTTPGSAGKDVAEKKAATNSESDGTKDNNINNIGAKNDADSKESMGGAPFNNGSHTPAEANEGPSYKISCAGTTPEDVAGLNNPTETLSGDVEEQAEAGNSINDLPKANAQNGLLTVYNPETGQYEIVDMTQYTKYKDYVSENEKLGIPNLPAAAGYAVKTEEKANVSGIILYVIVACGIIGLAAVIYGFRKKQDN